jgi:hypothetical protein
MGENSQWSSTNETIRTEFHALAEELRSRAGALEISLAGKDDGRSRRQWVSVRQHFC